MDAGFVLLFFAGLAVAFFIIGFFSALGWYFCESLFDD